jgi:hypothetical protein
MSSVYVLDTNIIIFMNARMPRDVYTGVWEAVEELIHDKRAVLPRMAYDELHRFDSCGPWAKGLPGFILDATDEMILSVQAITAAHPGWVRETTNAADPWVVACAERTRDAVLVTDERLKGAGVLDANLGIPNVAVERGVEWCNFNELARRERWTFTRG